MTKPILFSALAVAGLFAAAVPSAQAATPRHPYSNAKYRGDSGSAQVERLNAAQLDSARGGAGGVGVNTQTAPGIKGTGSSDGSK